MKKTTSKKSTRLALSTFTKLIRAAETVSADVHAELHSWNVSISQFGVLEALLHLGPMCQKDLARKILRSTGNITLVIDNLEKRDLVVRKRNKDDRRFIAIHLTAGGKKLIQDIFPQHAKRIVKRLAVLDELEQQELGRLCRKFKHAIPD